MRDTPTIASSAYGSTIHNLMETAPKKQLFVGAAQALPRFGGAFDEPRDQRDLIFTQLQQNMENRMVARRMVKVVIVDADENVPLNQCVLFSGEEQMTDLTDQELFFEIDIKQLLDAHNEKRVNLIDKKVKERTENLEPAKIRDLKMVVVNIASF